MFQGNREHYALSKLGRQYTRGWRSSGLRAETSKKKGGDVYRLPPNLERIPELEH